jgi:hypothetical protein
VRRAFDAARASIEGGGYRPFAGISTKGEPCRDSNLSSRRKVAVGLKDSPVRATYNAV